MRDPRDSRLFWMLVEWIEVGLAAVELVVVSSAFWFVMQAAAILLSFCGILLLLAWLGLTFYGEVW